MLKFTTTLDQYCTFLENLPVKPWRYFVLDVIENEEETMKNYEVMLARGFDPVPVYTYGQNVDAIDYYYSKTDYIGIGGLVGQPKNKLIRAVKKAQDKVNGRKSHLLGFTSMPYIKHFKPYSCDSSSWKGGGRFGNADIYAGNGQIGRAHV